MLTESLTCSENLCSPWKQMSSNQRNKNDTISGPRSPELRPVMTQRPPTFATRVLSKSSKVQWALRPSRDARSVERQIPWLVGAGPPAQLPPLDFGYVRQKAESG